MMRMALKSTLKKESRFCVSIKESIRYKVCDLRTFFKNELKCGASRDKYFLPEN